MRYPLDKFSAIPEEAKQTMAGEGINDSDNLLKRAEFPENRGKLAKRTGLGLEDLTSWAGMCDLVRIKGIGPVMAELLVSSGVAGNVQQLIQRFVSSDGIDENLHQGKPDQQATREEKAQQAHQKIVEYARQNNLTSRLPGAGELLDAVIEAIELRPRLVLSSPPDALEFKQELRSIDRQDLNLLKSRLKPVGKYALLTMILILVGAAVYTYFRLVYRYSGLPPVMRSQFSWIVTLYTNLGMWISLTLVVLFFWLLNKARLAYDAVWSRYVVTWLFRSPSHWNFYRAMQKQDKEKIIRSAYLGMGLMGLFLITFTFGMTMTNTQADLADWFERMYWPACIIGVLVAGIVAFQPLKFYALKIRGKKLYEKAAFQRYLINWLGVLAEFPLILFLITRLAVPGLQAFGMFFDKQVLIPGFNRSVSNTCVAGVPAIKALGRLTNYTDAESATICTRELTTDWQSLVRTVPEDVLQEVQSGLDWFLNSTILWLVVGALLFLFVIPYLIIGGIYRGLVYILLLFGIARAQGWLESNSLAWMGLAPESLGSKLLVYFLAIACVLIFDWSVGVFTEKKRACQQCLHELDDNDRFCPECGLMQP